jgi:hypothetical protein
LRRTRRHRTDRILLLFHATSTMMSCAPLVIAPSPVLSQNWETLAQRRRILTRVQCHLHPPVSFVAQPTNHRPLGFEAQTKKMLW